MSIGNRVSVRSRLENSHYKWNMSLVPRCLEMRLWILKCTQSDCVGGPCRGAFNCFTLASLASGSGIWLVSPFFLRSRTLTSALFRATGRRCRRSVGSVRTAGSRWPCSSPTTGCITSLCSPTSLQPQGECALDCDGVPLNNITAVWGVYRYS